MDGAVVSRVPLSPALPPAPLPPALWGKTLVLGASAVLVGELLRLGQRLLGRQPGTVAVSRFF